MRIAINLLYLLPGIVGGTETYASGLLSGLAAIDRDDEFLVFTNLEGTEWPIPDAPNFKRVVCPVSGSSRISRYRFEQLRLPRLLQEHSANIVHSLGYVSPLHSSCPRIVTIPDLNYRAFGNLMPITKRMALGTFVPLSARRASLIITISEFSQHEICRSFGLPTERTVVTSLAPRFRTASSLSLSARPDTWTHESSQPPYIVAFSGRTPNKNIPRLLQAFATARKTYGLPHQLVLVGHQPSGVTVSDLSSDPCVIFTGYLDDDSVQSLLAGAELLAFPSVYEGFGLPVLEAMAVGVPVVCSNRASLPEVAGDAALYFDPLSITQMAAALAKVALDERLRDDLRQRGFRNVQKYSWERTARETLEAYKRVLGTYAKRPE